VPTRQGRLFLLRKSTNRYVFGGPAEEPTTELSRCRFRPHIAVDRQSVPHRTANSGFAAPTPSMSGVRILARPSRAFRYRSLAASQSRAARRSGRQRGARMDKLRTETC
jgi:hypothetical protein